MKLLSQAYPGAVIAEDPRSLVGDGYWYLGSPYTKYPAPKGRKHQKGTPGMDAAFEEICRIAGWFIARGVNVYSPIAHTHPIAKYAGMDQTDHKIWLPADKPLMDGAKGLIIAMMPTWEVSYGLKHEADEFNKAGKPVFYLEV